MEMTAEPARDFTLIRIATERVDAAGAIRFKDRMQELAAGKDGRVVIDMTSVDFIDSSGLGAIVSAMKMLGPDRRLELAGVTPKVMKVFRLTRMDSVFTLHPDVEAARAAGATAG